ncbi:RloB-like protein [Actinocorallia herbida]|uniref:RloB-like protein n=1 Tax=Actinocorallia herbida TaxID=58109 RepID=A0A3N1D910_9ACTN|nr:RloB family protein [Actinocorallia herbida]ROO90027.1 RloB-like protein [Actinocorallia herbida]
MVFCEGQNSEPDYINGLKRLPHIAENTALDIRIHPEQGVPLTPVKMAREHVGDPEIDECWCIFDVEWPRNHPHLAQAVNLAESSGINLAISNPCFELWLILHHKQHGAFIDTNPAESLSRSLDSRTGKSIDAALYMPLRKQAARSAILLDKGHRQSETRFPHDNPSSGMYKFLKSLEGEG